MPLQIRVLAPKRDKCRRKHLVEKILWAPSWDKRVPTTWAPSDPIKYRESLAAIKPTSLEDLTNQVRTVTKQHTAKKQHKDQEHKDLLQGLRQAKDTLTRRAYQICLRHFLTARKREREESQLTACASGKDWTFARPQRLPKALHLPRALNGEQDRSQWGKLLQTHLEELYGADSAEKEATWLEVTKIHKAAFPPTERQPELVCDAEDIKGLFQELAHRKVGGLDGLPSQVWKAQPPSFHEVLAKEFTIPANSRDFRPVQRPQEWSYSLTTLLAKKPWPTELSQFRPISLMPHLQKLYTKWLYSRARPFIEEYLPVEQHGFRRGRQCAEILHAIARLREHTAEWRETFVLMKLDIAKAFDKVRRSALLRAMRDTGIPPRIVWALSREVLQSAMIPSLYAITTEAPIETHRGVRQGAPESGPVFCVCLAAALRQTLQKWRDLNYGHAVGPFRDLSAMLGFADDTLLLAKSPWDRECLRMSKRH